MTSTRIGSAARCLAAVAALLLPSRSGGAAAGNFYDFPASIAPLRPSEVALYLMSSTKLPKGRDAAQRFHRGEGAQDYYRSRVAPLLPLLEPLARCVVSSSS